MIEFQELLAERGVGLLVVPIPAKATVYPDKLFEGFPLGEAQGLGPLIDLLRSKGLRVLDLEAHFISRRRQGASEKFWCAQCYLIINWRIDELREFGEWRVPTEVYRLVAEHLHGYVYEDRLPPASIRQTIMNAADDFVRGQPVRFRAGDYIALQNFRREEQGR